MSLFERRGQRSRLREFAMIRDLVDGATRQRDEGNKSPGTKSKFFGTKSKPDGTDSKSGGTISKFKCLNSFADSSLFKDLR